MIGFFGLSHLGIVSSAACATRASESSQVLACDLDEALVSNLQASEFPVYEEGLKELYDNVKSDLTLSSDPSLLKECELIYISLDVKTDSDNASTRSEINNACDLVLNLAENGCTIVILSQLNPGFTRSLLGKYSRLINDKHLKLYYQVETLIFGSAVQRALEPERYIVGCENPESDLPEPYQNLLESFNCPILKMRYESAELAKTAINLFLVSSISTTNTLAEICNHIGADWNEIKEALKLDKRIGTYLNPGLGIAGGNLERDLVTILNLANDTGSNAELISSWMSHLKYSKDWLARTLRAEFKDTSGRRIGINKDTVLTLWGLAYKPDTKFTKNSAALALLDSFPNAKWQVYDPMVRLNKTPDNIKQCTSAKKALLGSSALIIATPWREFSEVNLHEIKEGFKGNLVLDPYGALDLKNIIKAGYRYYTLGRTPTASRTPTADRTPTACREK